MTSRLTDERIAEIEKLATALLPRGDWLVFEVADVIGEFRGACKDLLAEVKALKVEKESMAEEYSQRLSHEIDDYYSAWANQQVKMEQLKKQLTQAKVERMC